MRTDLHSATDDGMHGVVACLCAAWCLTCEAYRATFRAVADRHPGWRFVWIDIEAHSDELGDDALDIENFPTVMVVGDARQVWFHGTLLPHASTLERLVQAAEARSLAPVTAPVALVQGVLELAPGLLVNGPQGAAQAACRR